VWLARLGDIAPAELDEDAVGQVRTALLDHALVANPNLLADFVAANAHAVPLEAGMNPTLEIRHDHIEGMLPDALFELSGELLDLGLRRVGVEGVIARRERPVVERDIHIFGEAVDGTVHLGQRGAPLERHT